MINTDTPLKKQLVKVQVEWLGKGTFGPNRVNSCAIHKEQSPPTFHHKLVNFKQVVIRKRLVGFGYQQHVEIGKGAGFGKINKKQVVVLLHRSQQIRKARRRNAGTGQQAHPSATPRRLSQLPNGQPQRVFYAFVGLV